MAHPFLRALEDINNRAAEDGSSSSSAELDPKVFWPVNGFILILIVTACVFYCRGGFNWFNSGANADETYQETLQRRRDEAEEKRRGTPEQRKTRLLKSFQRCKVQMVVEESDLIQGDDKVVDCDDEEAPSVPVDEDEVGANGYLMLRETPQDELTVRRQVPNCCAICLGDYEVGERVVWSSNSECAHAFHMECLVDWLTKMRDGTPCPCCRAEFTDLDSVQKESRVTWNAGHAFNFSSVRL